MKTGTERSKMDYTELPPLPKHDRPNVWGGSYSDEAMRAYAIAAIAAAAPAIMKAELERCAKVCEAVNAGNTYKNSPLGCAKAIRDLPEDL